MIAFQRLSTVPTVPELLRQAAEKRAICSCRSTPIEAWCRSATIAIVWQRRLDGLMGSVGTASAASNTARSRHQAAMQQSPAAGMLRAWSYRAGVMVCLAGASGVLAAARAAEWCCLVSPDGLGTAIACANRLTRAAMRIWRSGRAHRKT